MSIEEKEFKRIGPPTAVNVNGDFVYLQIVLNGKPTPMWTELFKNPKDRMFDVVHPSNAVVRDNRIFFRCERSKIEESVKWVDKYIEQANSAYHARTGAEQKDSDRREALRKDRAAANKVETDRITESIKQL